MVKRAEGLLLKQSKNSSYLRHYWFFIDKKKNEGVKI
jgi:hypothetical protein